MNNSNFAPSSFLTYESRMDRDFRWALQEGSLYFEQRGSVWATLRKIMARLAELEIPYAVAGTIAMFQHGYRRFTEDVDILVRSEDLERLRCRHSESGCVEAAGERGRPRDAEFGVRIVFLIAGEYPGDRKPKPVAFPGPLGARVELAGIPVLSLVKLVEVKLAAGIGNERRMQDLVDVQELIGVLSLPKELGEELNPYVRAKYEELWRNGRKRFITVLRNEKLTGEEKSVAEVIGRVPEAALELSAMERDGVALEAGAAGAGFVTLVTIEPEVAGKYDMHEREA